MNTIEIITAIVASIAIISLLSVIGFFIGKSQGLKNSQGRLEVVKKKILTQEKRNQRLKEELNKNIQDAEDLVQAIKEEDEKVQIIHMHEEMKKNLLKKSIYAQTYQDDEEKSEKTTNIVAAQIFTKSKELSEEEKRNLVEASSETETVSSGFEVDSEAYEEAKQMRSRLSFEMNKSKSRHKPLDYDPYEGNDKGGGR